MRGAAVATADGPGDQRRVFNQRITRLGPAAAAFEHVGEPGKRLGWCGKALDGAPQFALGAVEIAAEGAGAPKQHQRLAARLVEQGGPRERGLRLVQRERIAGFGGPQPHRPEGPEDRARLREPLGGAAQREHRGVVAAGAGVGRADGDGPLRPLGFEGGERRQFVGRAGRVPASLQHVDPRLADLEEARRQPGGGAERRQGLVEATGIAQADAEQVVRLGQAGRQRDGLA